MSAQDTRHRTPSPPGGRDYATVHVAGLLFGVDVHRVQEVVWSQPLTRVPLAHPDIEGLLNLRGQIVTAIDLRRRLDLGQRPDGCPPMHAVVHTEDGPVSLLADDVGDVVSVQAAQFEPTPPTVRPPVSQVITGVYKLDGRLLLVLDVERTVIVEGLSPRRPSRLGRSPTAEARESCPTPQRP